VNYLKLLKLRFNCICKEEAELDINHHLLTFVRGKNVIATKIKTLYFVLIYIVFNTINAFTLFRISMDNSKLQIWSGSHKDLLTTLCHVTLQHETLNVWIEPSSS